MPDAERFWCNMHNVLIGLKFRQSVATIDDIPCVMQNVFGVTCMSGFHHEEADAWHLDTHNMACCFSSTLRIMTPFLQIKSSVISELFLVYNTSNCYHWKWYDLSPSVGGDSNNVSNGILYYFHELW